MSGRFPNSTFFDLSNPGWDRDDHPGARPHTPAVHLGNEMPKHRLGDFEIGNDAILQRPDRYDIRRGSSEHSLRFIPYRQHFVGARLHSHH